MEKEQLAMQCSECGAEFTRKKRLYLHLRKYHDVDVQDSPNLPSTSKKKETKELCSVCGKSFTCKGTLVRHMTNVHKRNYVESSQRKTRLYCPEENCMEAVPSYDCLRKHLLDVHAYNVELETLEFSSQSDFEKWKEMMQQQTSSYYVQDTSLRELGDGRKRQFLNCHRSYSYRSKGKGLRSIKSQGTNKIGKACPSRIEVTKIENESECTISVKFWKSHCGHSLDLGRTLLNKTTRDAIADKLQEGVSVEHILDTIRNGCWKDDASQRILLINKKDIHNIIRDYSLDYSTKHHDRSVNAADNNTTSEEISQLIIMNQPACSSEQDRNNDDIRRKTCVALTLIDKSVPLNFKDARLANKCLDKLLEILKKNTSDFSFEAKPNVNVNKNRKTGTSVLQ